MARIHIVTDSGATFSNPRLVKHYPVTILPNQIEIGGQRFQEDVDLETEDAFAADCQAGRSADGRSAFRK